VTPPRLADMLEELAGLALRMQRGFNPRIGRELATVVLLLNPSSKQLLGALGSSTARVDARLLRGLYEAGSSEWRIALTSAPAIRFLAPSFFEPMWEGAYRKARTPSQMIAMAFTLAGYLRRNPARAQRFRPYVARYLWGSTSDVRLRGLELVGLMGNLTEAELGLLRRSLASRSPATRMQALYALSLLGDRRGGMSARTARQVFDDQLRVRVARLAEEDPDPDVRLGASNCLAAIRPATAHRRSRRPPPASRWSTIATRRRAR